MLILLKIQITRLRQQMPSKFEYRYPVSLNVEKDTKRKSVNLSKIFLNQIDHDSNLINALNRKF